MSENLLDDHLRRVFFDQFWVNVVIIDIVANLEIEEKIILERILSYCRRLRATVQSPQGDRLSLGLIEDLVGESQV